MHEWWHADKDIQFIYTWIVHYCIVNCWILYRKLVHLTEPDYFKRLGNSQANRGPFVFFFCTCIFCNEFNTKWCRFLYRSLTNYCSSLHWVVPEKLQPGKFKYPWKFNVLPLALSVHSFLPFENYDEVSCF